MQCPTAARIPVGFRKWATCAEQQLHATRSYSLIKPPSTVRRLIRSWLRSATGDPVVVGEVRGHGAVVDRCRGERTVTCQNSMHSP